MKAITYFACAFLMFLLPAKAQENPAFEKLLFSSLESPTAVYERFFLYWDGALLVDEQELLVHYRGQQGTRMRTTLNEVKQSALSTAPKAKALIWRDKWVAVRLDTLLEGRNHAVFMYSEQGDLLEHRDLNVYHHSLDTTVVVRTFLPDPLTPFGYSYGGSYVDMNDQNGAVLDSLTVLDTLQVAQSGDTAILSNSFARLVDFDAPYTPISKDANRWTSGRSEPEFEQVSALYHITRMRQYLASIGYGNLMTYRIDVDAQAMNGQDNSMFNYGYVPPRLYFGEGGVDDAEDADVVIHELGHALSHAAAPYTNSGLERRTFDEAVSDYFAERYGRLLGITSTRVFDWDGNNAFWSGRGVAYDGIKDYTNLVFSSIYQHTDIISSAMLELSAALPDSLGDVMVLEVLYNLLPNDGLDDISQEFLVVDNLLSNGIYHSTIYAIFDGTRNLIQQNNVFDENAPVSVQLGRSDAGYFLLHDLAGKPYTVECFSISGQLLSEAILVENKHVIPAGTGVVRISKNGHVVFSSALPL